MLGAAVAVGAITGCSSEVHSDDKPPPAAEAPIMVTDAYPAGPFGDIEGKIIKNYVFPGYVNPVADSSKLQEIKLEDFYNPTGSEVYPEGSPYGAGNTRPKALLINVSAVWCGPCQVEADEVLPEEYAKLKPLGGQFLLQLADGPTPGVPAVEKHLAAWTKKYDVDYPSAIDPQYQVGALFDAAAFPGNMIIRTRTMEIVEILNGAPDESFWTKFEGVLAEK